MKNFKAISGKMMVQILGGTETKSSEMARETTINRAKSSDKMHDKVTAILAD